MRKQVSKKHILVSFLLWVTAICFAQEKEVPEYQKEAQQFVFSGNEQLLEGNVLEGEKSYRKAIAKDPNNLEAKYNLGYSYYKTNNFEEAAMRSKQAVENAKNKAEKHAAYHNLGNAYLKMQKPDEAIEAYKNALRNNPTDEETRYNLAVAKQMKQQQDQNKDQNQENDENKEGDEEKENENKDKSDEGEEDKKDKDKEGDNEDDKKEEEKEGDKDEEKDKEDEKDKDGEGDEKEDDKKPPQAREGKLSPDQVKSLLEAMAEEEKKVQDKMNDKKQGVKVKTDKDW